MPPADYKDGPGFKVFMGLYQSVFHGGGGKGAPRIPMLYDGITAGKFNETDWTAINVQVPEPGSLVERIVQEWIYVSGEVIFDWVICMVRLLFYFEKYHKCKTVLRNPDVIRSLQLGKLNDEESLEQAESRYAELVGKDWTIFQDADPILHAIQARFDMNLLRSGYHFNCLDHSFNLDDFQNSIVECMLQITEGKEGKYDSYDWIKSINEKGCHQKTDFPASRNLYLMYPFTYRLKNIPSQVFVEVTIEKEEYAELSFNQQIGVNKALCWGGFDNYRFARIQIELLKDAIKKDEPFEFDYIKIPVPHDKKPVLLKDAADYLKSILVIPKMTSMGMWESPEWVKELVELQQAEVKKYLRPIRPPVPPLKKTVPQQGTLPGTDIQKKDKDKKNSDVTTIFLGLLTIGLFLSTTR